MTIVHQAEPCERSTAWEQFNERMTIALCQLVFDFDKRYPGQVKRPRADSSLNNHEQPTILRRKR